MAGLQSVFSGPLPISNELYRLVQDQLSEAPRTNSLDDLRTTVETLSTLTNACESVLTDISARGEKTDLRTAVDRVRNVLSWTKFLDTVKTTPSDIDFLFRAHKHVGTSQPTFSPGLNIPFDLRYRCTSSIDNFALELGLHLDKTREDERGGKIATTFVSMTPMLEWTLHTTGQKWRYRDQTADEVAGLAIFDVEKLRQTSDTAIFRVSDVLDFLASQGKDQLIRQDLQRWARNCNEYVLMGRIPNNGLVRWLEWEELSTLPALLFPGCFLRAYTLAQYCKWRGTQHFKLGDICQRIVESGKILAGPRDDVLLPLTELILRPGIHFWGFEIDSLETDAVKAKIRVLVDEATLLKLS